MNGNRKRILIADDDEGFLFPMKRAILRAGFEAICVTNADDILKKGLTVDALIIDVRLPTSNNEGLKAAAELVGRGLDDAIPLIFVSVYKKDSDAVKKDLDNLSVFSTRKRRFEWLGKPFEPSALVKLLRKLLP